mmetsp:Transcript_892/g.3101  ORF Transcript_892/g.3101 Transcript_892/m.3101 type:complete len:119 (-) Transcript_892:125-481(-)
MGNGQSGQQRAKQETLRPFHSSISQSLAQETHESQVAQKDDSKDIPCGTDLQALFHEGHSGHEVSEKMEEESREWSKGHIGQEEEEEEEDTLTILCLLLRNRIFANFLNLCASLRIKT